MDSLFTIPESKSPRLRWMEKYQVTVVKTAAREKTECEITGKDVCPFLAYSGSIFGPNDEPLNGPCGEGATEDEALSNLAVKLGIKLWNEEGA